MHGLDDAPGLSDPASSVLRDNRPGKNTIHRLDITGLTRRSANRFMGDYGLESAQVRISAGANTVPG
ncbi:MAG: hypothetical protein GDA36_08355 [Rhodobacteraceae bacterium]|nr:hypothetical protein [Paracoccaceae bacterium]